MEDEPCIDRVIDDECRSRPDRVIAELAGRQHGVVARRQLLAAGIGRGAIEVRVVGGRLHLLHRGVYAVGHVALTVAGRWMAAALACGPGAVLSHRAAGQAWRILPHAAALPEVTRPGTFRARPGILGHQAPLLPDEVDSVRDLPVTSVSRTLFDLAAVLPLRGLERATNEAEVRGLTDRLSLPDLLERYPGRRGAANLRALLSSTVPTGVTQNEFEEAFVGLIDAYGLPRPQLNGTLAIRGRLLRPDCMWRRERLIVELDGGAVHRTAKAFESDRQRDRILVAEG
jgi:hypothetical protein